MASDIAVYDSYGNLLADQRPIDKAWTTHRDSVGFAGQWGGETDWEVNFGSATLRQYSVLMTHRYYDPRTGRFINRDPIGYSGGVNVYGYAGGNPVNFADPYGHDAGDWVDKYLLGGAISNLGDTAGRYDSGRATKGELVRASISSGVQVTVLAVSIVDGAAAVRAAPRLLTQAAKQLPKLYPKSKTIQVIDNAAGLGGTTASGNIRISSELEQAGSEKLLAAPIRHETIHSALTPTVLGLAQMRVAIYNGSQLFRYIEEAIAESYGSGNIINGLLFPIKKGYSNVEGVLRESNLLVNGGRAINNSLRK